MTQDHPVTRTTSEANALLDRATRAALDYKMVFGLTGGRMTADLAGRGSAVAKDANLLNLPGRPGSEHGWAMQFLGDANLILAHAAGQRDVDDAVARTAIMRCMPEANARAWLRRADELSAQEATT